VDVGYRGKTAEQERARELRAEGWTYTEICTELGVSKSSVSLWCREINVNEEMGQASAGEQALRRSEEGKHLEPPASG
jgi:transcriptional regulator with XRE-family HTH domain